MGRFNERRNSGGSHGGGRNFGGGGRGFGGGGRGRDFGQREMHKTTCSECGQDCEVPFKPTEGKPVYCRECFRKKRSF